MFDCTSLNGPAFSWLFSVKASSCNFSDAFLTFKLDTCLCPEYKNLMFWFDHFHGVFERVMLQCVLYYRCTGLGCRKFWLRSISTDTDSTALNLFILDSNFRKLKLQQFNVEIRKWWVCSKITCSDSLFICPNVIQIHWKNPYTATCKKQWIFNPHHKSFNQVNPLAWEEHQEGLVLN